VRGDDHQVRRGLAFVGENLVLDQACQRPRMRSNPLVAEPLGQCVEIGV
jgi:hypothetical protein